MRKLIILTLFSAIGYAQESPKYLFDDLYFADPSVHVFDGKIYIYPSHDIQTHFKDATNGAHFNMKDYHVLTLDNVNEKARDNGIALKLEDVSWAKQQLWASDVAKKGNKYYLYFPAKDQNDLFKIGVASSKSPYGSFTFQGEILTPVIGWTTHHSIVEIDKKWYLFYHDSKNSGEKSYLRSLKVRERKYDQNGMILPMNGQD